MSTKVVLGVVFSFCAAGVFAGSLTSSSPAAGVAEQSMDVFPPNHQPRTVALERPELEDVKRAPGVTEETVGDPYSFGANMIYLGVAQTESVDLQEDCSAYPPDAGRCIETNPAPASTSVDEAGLATIVLPGKSTKTILCFTVTPFATWEWFNPTASQQNAAMTLSPTVRIESEALLDPSLINPVTGAPFNGAIDVGPIRTFYQIRSLDPNEYDFQRQVMTRSCTAGVVNEGALRDSYGLTDAVIKQFFKNEITVSFGVGGNVSLTTFVNYTVGIRLYGDK